MRPLLRRAAAAAKPPTAAQRRCFRYHLPQSSIAKYPASPRGSSRLLVANDGELTDSRFEALTSHLPRDALVIVNDSRVVRARLRCGGPDGAFEVLLLARRTRTRPAAAAAAEGQAWRAMLRRSDVAPGQTFAVDGDIHLRVAAVHSPWLEAGEADGVEADVALGGCGARTLGSLLDAHGTTPVPPYLDRPDDDSDDDAYQTAYAAGSVAARRASTSRTATSRRSPRRSRRTR
ncbi:queuosine biosynthesis protein [Aureococcus anophagefferens]|nr:queuosine biosynthesis protein [Aureococcus anophagefferens]